MTRRRCIPQPTRIESAARIATAHLPGERWACADDCTHPHHWTKVAAAYVPVDDRDDLRAARGIGIGLVIVVPLWVGLVLWGFL